MILPALALAIKTIAQTTTLLMLTYGGEKVQDVSYIDTFPNKKACITRMEEFFEIHEEDILDGKYTFQCDQSNGGSND